MKKVSSITLQHPIYPITHCPNYPSPHLPIAHFLQKFQTNNLQIKRLFPTALHRNLYSRKFYPLTLQ